MGEGGRRLSAGSDKWKEKLSDGTNFIQGREGVTNEYENYPMEPCSSDKTQNILTPCSFLIKPCVVAESSGWSKQAAKQ